MASSEIQRQIKSMGALNGSDHHAALAFEETAAVLDLEPWLVQRFRHPVEESTAYLQILRDSGETVCVPFHVVHHSEMSGCAVGSCRSLPACSCVTARLWPWRGPGSPRWLDCHMAERPSGWYAIRLSSARGN